MATAKTSMSMCDVQCAHAHEHAQWGLCCALCFALCVLCFVFCVLCFVLFVSVFVSVSASACAFGFGSARILNSKLELLAFFSFHGYTDLGSVHIWFSLSSMQYVMLQCRALFDGNFEVHVVYGQMPAGS